MFKFVLIAAFVAATSAIDIPFDSCGANYRDPISFDIPECAQLPCDLSVGAFISLNIGINVDRVTTALPVLATVTQNGVTSNWDLPTGNACHGIVGGCPLVPGNYSIWFPLTIDNIAGQTETIMRVEISDDAGDSVACGSITDTFQ